MAILFTSYSTGEKFLIGGQSVLTGADDGNIGTMPAFSVNRTETLLGDGTYIGSVFDITVAGTARTVADLDITTKGASQSAVQALALNNLKFNKSSSMFGHGRLEISPYGGMPNSIVFSDARLISVDIPDQDENSSGTQYLPYTFNFQATFDSSIANNSDWGLSINQPTWKLKSASETWDLSEGSDFSYADGEISNENKKFKTYILNHTISAQGVKLYSNESLDADNGHAWRQAAGWVKSRLDASENPGDVIQADLMGNTTEVQAKFNALYMSENNDTKIKNLVTDGYIAKNKTRTINSDISTGSYSVTDNWLITKGEINATHTVEVSIDNAVENDAITVTVNGSVNGLSRLDVDNNLTDKYQNALTEYKRFYTGANTVLDTQMGIIASDVYSNFTAVGNKSGQLYSATSFTESHDKVNGVISWSASFSDNYIGYFGATYQKITYSYTNDQYNRYRTAKPSVIDTVAFGPYIYLPGTTDEKTLSITVDMNIAREFRTGTPPNGASLIPNLSGLVEYQYFSPIETSRTESWNPLTGVYNLQITYTYA